MRVFRFLFREGSPFVFTALIVLFSVQITPMLALPANAYGMFIITVIALIYLGMQMALAAFAKVGHDGPLIDLFLSMVPLIALIIIEAFAFAGMIHLDTFQHMGLIIALAVIVMDLGFNTQVLFKMNRLASDFVQME